MNAKAYLPAQRLFRAVGHRPLSILLGFEGGMMALNDRLKLRSMVVAEKTRGLCGQ